MSDLPEKQNVPPMVRRRLKLPLVECAHEAMPGEEMTPERSGWRVKVTDVFVFETKQQ